MNRKAMIVCALVIALAGIGTLAWYFEQPRLTSGHMQKVYAAKRHLEQAKAVDADSVVLAQSETKVAAPPADKIQEQLEEKVEEASETKVDGKVEEESETKVEGKDEAWPVEAPDTFKIRFECSNGVFVIECHKEWAPIGVQHMYDLVRAHYYDGARFFRVIPGFMAQFGLPGDPAVYEKLGKKNLKDDPALKHNTPGMVTYAKTGAPNSRSTQLFINYGDNRRLDGMGFAPFAQVTSGMDVARHINAEYQERPNQNMIQVRGNAYLKEQFPRLDFIKKATLIKD